MSFSTFQNTHIDTKVQPVKVQTFQTFCHHFLSLSLSLMERLEAEKARARRVTVAKNKKEGVLCLYTPPPAGQKLALPPLHQPRAPSSEVKLKLAAVVVDLNVRLRLANMPPTMQERAFRHTRSLLDSTPEKKKPSPTHLAMCLKKVSSETLKSIYYEPSS
jgi:hypothetical protein